MHIIKRILNVTGDEALKVLEYRSAQEKGSSSRFAAEHPLREK